MKIKVTRHFRFKAKKLFDNQKKDLDGAVRIIGDNPKNGELKVGDLPGVYVYKFRMARALQLLAYRWDEEDDVLLLCDFGTHENFYRDLKSALPHLKAFFPTIDGEDENNIFDEDEREAS